MFLSPLQQYLKTKDFEAMLKYLTEQTSSGVHLALSELGPMSGGTIEELTGMLEFFEYHMERAHQADLLQTYLALFLNKHGSDLTSTSDTKNTLDKILEKQKTLWGGVDMQFQKCICFLKILTQTQSQW